MSQPIFRRLADRFRFRRDRKAPQAARTRPGVEHLENRLAPAVFYVNSLADVFNPGPGVVTLRSAIQAADTNHDASNTIYLTLPGTYRIRLPGAANETDNAAGEFAITGTGNLSIVNASRGRVVVDGGGMNRVFDINPAAENTTPFTVTFQGLTIQHGSAAPGDGSVGSGGGIRAEGAASVVLNSVVLAHNYATADGAGIALESINNDSTGTLTVNASTIIDNHAGDAGGGIETDGTGLVTVNPGTVITENTCVNQGAGIWLDAGGASLNVNGALISDNSALTMLAGGIGNAGAGNVTIVDSVIEDNFSGGTGGGFGDAANTGSLTVVHSLFLDNRAVGDGGGIQEGAPSTTILYSTFDGNTSAGADGGGALFVNGGTVTVTNSAFRDNVGVNGGGIEDQATTLTLTHDTFDANHALGTNGGNGNNPGPGGSGGGGLDVRGNAATVTVAFSLFLDNSANNGFNGNGGAINQLAGTLTVTDSQFTGNFTGSLGGAIDFAGSTFTIGRSTFNGNSALNSGGALEYATTQTNAPASSLSDDTFTANSAGFFGGAIVFDGFGTVYVSNDTINGNTAALRAGGIVLEAFPLSVVFQNTIVALNTAGGASSDIISFVGNPIVTDHGGNLIGTTNNLVVFGPGTLRGDPKFGPLEYNGGPLVGAPGEQTVLVTEALLPGSPAFGKGLKSGAPTTDERGFATGTTPSIGAYQPQYAANATPNQVFVESIYETLLDRPADPGAAVWVTLLNRGVSPVVIVQALENSGEYRANEVKALYQHYLQRQADPAAPQAFVNFLQHGGTIQQAAEILISTPEYFQLHGGTNYTFVEGLYEDVLGRRPEKYGPDALSQALAGGTSRFAVASLAFGSPEFAANQADSLFRQYLGRDTDPGTAANVESLLQRGVSEDVVLSLLLGSQEAYAKRS